MNNWLLRALGLNWERFLIGFAEDSGAGGGGDDSNKDEEREGNVGGDSDDEKKFSQEELNRIISREKNKVKSQVTSELKEKMLTEEEIEEYQRLREEKEKIEQKRLAERGEFDKLKKKMEEKHKKQLQEKEEKANKILSKLEKVQIDNSLISSAAKQNAIDPEEVATLLRPHVKLDEDLKPIVVTNDGERRISSKEGSTYMGIEELVATYLEKKPYHVKSSVKSGSGGDKVQSPKKSSSQENDFEGNNSLLKISEGLAERKITEGG